MREESKQRIRQSVTGRYGEKSRAWKGDKAGYVAIHCWVKIHFAKKDHCEQCGRKPPEISRLESANISGKYFRIKSDWLTLCTSCHLKRDFRLRIKACPQGHEYNKETTYFNNRGHRGCRICRKKADKKYKERRCRGA